MDQQPQSSRLVELTSSLSSYVVAGFLALFPIFFLLFTSNPIEINKIALMIVACSLLGLALIVQIMKKGSVLIRPSTILAALVLFTGTSVLSALATSSNRIDAFSGRTLVMLVMTGFFFFSTTIARRSTTIALSSKSNLFLWAYTFSAGLLGIFVLLQPTGFGLPWFINRSFGVSLPNSITFQTTGSLLLTLFLLISATIAHLTEVFAQKEKLEKTIHSGFFAFFLLASVVTGYFLLPNNEGALIFQPFSSSWSIAMDILKQPKTALIGVGPESYLSAFTQYKPVSLNTTPYWNVRFGSARIEVLQILTTTGIIGLLAFVFFYSSAFRTMFPLRAQTRSLVTIAATLLLYHLVFPATTVSFGILVAILSAICIEKNRQNDQDIIALSLFSVRSRDLYSSFTEQKSERLVRQISVALVSLLVFLGQAWSVLWFERLYRVEVLLQQSYMASVAGDLQKQYDLQAKTIALLPQSDRVRQIFATTNYLIATGIAGKKELSEQDKTTLNALVLQAVQEAKNATALNPLKTQNWETLLSIYQQLIGVVPEAEQWAVAGSVRAIQTDPANAMLRLNLGMLYAQLQDHNQATLLYRQAIELKPNLPGAYFQLSISLQELSRFEEAYQAMVQAQTLAKDPTLQVSEEEIKVIDEQVAALKKVVDDLQKQREAQQAQSQTTGTTSSTPTGTTQQQESSLPSGAIRLPEELGLPEEEAPTGVPTGTNESTPEPVATSPSPEPTPTPAE